MNFSFENRNDRFIRLTTTPYRQSADSRHSDPAFCKTALQPAFPRNPAGKTVVAELNPWIVMEALRKSGSEGKVIGGSFCLTDGMFQSQLPETTTEYLITVAGYPGVQRHEL